MKPAARIGDQTSHGAPLSPGPGSADVLIGDRRAWRALPTSQSASVRAASSAMQTLMQAKSLTPADAAALLANAQAALRAAAAGAKAEGAQDAPATNADALAQLNADNVRLSARWASASSAPGGQPAASLQYARDVKSAAAKAATATFSALAGAADTHVCPAPATPPHGPGLVTQASRSVLFNNLPAVRAGDRVIEAAGGADAIAAGCATVQVGD